MIDVNFGNVGVEVLALNEPQKEFVDHLYVGPCNLQNGLIFLRIKGISLGIDWRWNWSEEVLAEHFYHLRIHGLGDDLTIVGNIIQEFVQREPLNFLGLHISTRIIKIEDNVALLNLLHEQILPTIWWNFMEPGELFEFSLTLV